MAWEIAKVPFSPEFLFLRNVLKDIFVFFPRSREQLFFFLWVLFERNVYLLVGGVKVFYNCT